MLVAVGFAVSVGSTVGAGVLVAFVGFTDGVGMPVAAASLVGVRVGTSGSGVVVGGMAVGGRVAECIASCVRRFSTIGRPIQNNAARIVRVPAPTSRDPIQADGLLFLPRTPPPHD